MANEFSITAATNAVQLDNQNQATATFTVYNASGREISGRASLETEPTNLPHSAWLQIDGEPERSFTIGGTEQYVVKIAAPEGASAETYTFRLNIVETENPDEGFNPGPSVTFTVPEPKEPEQKFPMWIIPVVIGVIAVLGIIAWLLLRGPREVTIPDVIGLEEEDALETIEALDLRHRPGASEFSAIADEGRVARVAPEPGEAVEPETRVEYFLSLGQEPTVPPPPTPDLTATAEVVIETLISKYAGRWVASNSDGFLTHVIISNENPNVGIDLYGTSLYSAFGGELQTLFCLTTPETDPRACLWEELTVPYEGDPMSFTTDESGGISHEISITISPNGQALSVLDQVSVNGVVQKTESYALTRELPILRVTAIFVPNEVFEVQPINPNIFELIVTPSP